MDLVVLTLVEAIVVVAAEARVSSIIYSVEADQRTHAIVTMEAITSEADNSQVHLQVDLETMVYSHRSRRISVSPIEIYSNETRNNNYTSIIIFKITQVLKLLILYFGML